MAALAALGLIAFIVLIGFWAKGARQSYENTLKVLGQPFGWSYERTKGHGLQSAVGVGHVMRGWVDGRAFELVVAPEGRNKYLSERWMIAMAGPLPGGFAAGKNGLLRGTSAGMTKLTTGDAEFDKKVLCEATDPAQGWVVVQAEPRKAALRELATMNAVLFDNKLRFHKVGFDTKLAKLQARLDKLRSIAAALDPVQPPMQPYVAQQQLPPAGSPPREPARRCVGQVAKGYGHRDHAWWRAAARLVAEDARFALFLGYAAICSRNVRACWAQSLAPSSSR
jgi:hypothetical protein